MSAEDEDEMEQAAEIRDTVRSVMRDLFDAPVGNNDDDDAGTEVEEQESSEANN